MDYHSAEEQQVEALKRWWKENGNSLLIGVGLALAAIFGWKAYQNNEANKRYEASSIYQQMLEASIEARDPEKREKSLPTLNLLGSKLKEGYGASGYAMLGSLILAKHHVDSGELDKAVAELTLVVNADGIDEAIQVTAKERLARVLAEKGDNDQALTMLDSIKKKAYLASALEAKGDILLKNGQKEEARNAYEQSKAAQGDSESTGNSLLEMKLSYLSAEPGI